MAYDSATDTELAGQAWKAALLAADNRRTALNTGFGMNADGSMDNSDLGHLGSLYQGNLGSVMDEQSATMMDRRRGFGSDAGGLGHKGQARAHQAALDRQALNFRDANSQLGANTAEHDAANQQYENDKATIRSKSAWDTAQTLAANPVDDGSGDTSPAAAAGVVTPFGSPPVKLGTKTNSTKVVTPGTFAGTIGEDHNKNVAAATARKAAAVKVIAAKKANPQAFKNR